jgi:hypothetical protein
MINTIDFYKKKIQWLLPMGYTYNSWYDFAPKQYWSLPILLENIGLHVKYGMYGADFEIVKLCKQYLTEIKPLLDAATDLKSLESAEASLSNMYDHVLAFNKKANNNGVPSCASLTCRTI